MPELVFNTLIKIVGGRQPVSALSRGPTGGAYHAPLDPRIGQGRGRANYGGEGWKVCNIGFRRTDAAEYLYCVLLSSWICVYL